MSNPTNYSDETALAICERHAAGETIKAICSSTGMPGRRTVYHWLKRHPEFAELFHFARQDFLAKLMRDILQIADAVTTVEEVPVARLKIDARRLIAQMTMLTDTRRAEARNSGRAHAMPTTVTINLEPDSST